MRSSFFFFFFVDIEAAYSAIIGGGISIIVTAYFAGHVFSVRAGSTASKIARAFFVGESIKMVLTAILFAVAILWLDILFLPLFLTYIATLFAYWLVLPFTVDSSVKTL